MAFAGMKQEEVAPDEARHRAVDFVVEKAPRDDYELRELVVVDGDGATKARHAPGDDGELVFAQVE